MAFLMTMLFGMGVLAAETETPENEEIIEEIESVTNEYHSGTFYGTYTDRVNVVHYVTVSASCTATYSWDEGYVGWITSVIFNTPTVTIDGVAASVQYASSVQNTSYADEAFHVNNSLGVIRLYFTVDGYGVMFNEL